MMNQRGLIAMDVFESMEHGFISTVILILILALWHYFVSVPFVFLPFEHIQNKKIIESNDLSLKEEFLKFYPNLNNEDIN